MGDINAFVDHGYADPAVFAKKFFDSPDFTSSALRRILQTGTSGNKEALAGEIWRRLSTGDLEPNLILRRWADQPRRWLSFKIGTGGALPNLGTPEALLTRFGEDGWHGPIPDPAGSCNWYIRTQKMFHFRFIRNEPRLSHVRWAVMAKVTDGCIALHWNNFSHRPENVMEETSRNPFWQHIPGFFREMEEMLGGSWRSPVLHRLVLHELWDLYRENPDYRWSHLKIRAERHGVALNARSAGVLRHQDVVGLEGLTKNLAQAAARAGNVTDKDLIRAMEAELLEILLREWGANSYAFQLDQLEPENDKVEKVLFKGHCYFGLRQGLQSQDRFQHVECYQDSGGSTGALKFFLASL